ncbi:lipid-A-disaccharide synthase [Anaerosporomusa subterranea]|uniref:Lipid-A-disaccharide synthase n=1 Tax=Anaerosporomusa subterranea TaxID=1794912 RepID=A0A154BR62_ANASB|nr:lipid-A-disaccharide synthase [Anaerosporomusa subterranea]KYZ76379.1 lipid-A-disaccharide synthase [Anaerosporomusa subterranea]
MKIMFSAGEASGDLHGASVAKALKALAPDVTMFGMGGRHMAEAGVEIVYDIADLGVIGIVEVIKNLPRLFRLRDMLGEIMDRERPDVLVVIDYPGFNTRLAKVAKAKGIPIVSYISPSAWAWGKGRAKEVAQTVSKVAAIFPFEADVYREAGADVVFVGHPLLDIVKPTMTRQEAFSFFGADPARPVLLLLPGSRKQEIENLLPDILDAAAKIAAKLPECQFFLPVASTIPENMLTDLVAKRGLQVSFTHGHTYDLMSIADVAIAASGTVTLEAALLQLPSVIIYKVNSLTYYLGKLLVKIPHIGLPNIVAGRKILPELLQHNANPDAIAEAALPLLTDQQTRQTVLADLAIVSEKLGSGGAVKRVAEVILSVAGDQPKRGD